MARILNIHDNEVQARIRREQNDPLAMTIVVNKKTILPVTELAQQVIEAVRKADKELTGNKDYQTWLDGSFRKICLKARPGQFAQLQSEESITSVGDVIICPPQHKSSRYPILKKMQTLQQMKDDFDDFEPVVGGFLINKSLQMSHGKILAQLAHAALLAKEVKVAQIGYLHGDWESTAKEFDVICTKDGGITEIAAGSETIMSIVAPATL